MKPACSHEPIFLLQKYFILFINYSYHFAFPDWLEFSNLQISVTLLVINYSPIIGWRDLCIGSISAASPPPPDSYKSQTLSKPQTQKIIHQSQCEHESSHDTGSYPLSSLHYTNATNNTTNVFAWAWGVWSTHGWVEWMRLVAWMGWSTHHTESGRRTALWRSRSKLCIGKSVWLVHRLASRPVIYITSAHLKQTSGMKPPADANYTSYITAVTLHNTDQHLQLKCYLYVS